MVYDKVYDTRWIEYFGTEEKLVEAVKTIDVHKYNECCNNNICSGYRYVTTIVRSLRAGNSITSAQLRMIKRLASQIYKYHQSVDKRH